MESFKMWFSVFLSKLEFVERKVLEIPVEKLFLLSCAAQHHTTFSKNSYYVFLIHSLLSETGI